MKLRNILYSLRNVDGKVVLSIDLTAKILSEESSDIIVDLPTGISHIRKADYLNKMKIYEVDEKLFFLICDKKVSRKHVFEVLMKHAISKVENRINYLDSQLDDLGSRKSVLENLKATYTKMVAA